MKLLICEAIFGIALGAVACYAQIRPSEGQPGPDPSALDQYHIPRIADALVAALSHADFAVRGEAAMVLAGRGEKGAVPPILAALAGETVPDARMKLANALALLGAEDGVVALKAMCADRRWSQLERMGAASRMLSTHHDECLSDVVEVLRAHDDDQATLQALSLLGRFEHPADRDIAEIRRVLPILLRGDDRTVRFYSAEAFPQFGDAIDLYLLQAALVVEKDDDVRDAMITAVKQLAAKLVPKQ